jgi:hypothetical protein
MNQIYVLVTDGRDYKLEQIVNEYLRNGATLVGGVSVSIDGNFTIFA